jgi:hypothetical protein
LAYRERDRSYFYILGGYFFVFFLAIFVPRVRLWGQITDKKSGGSIEGLTVEINHPDLESIIVGKATTSKDGKYFLRANEGKYRLIVRDKTEDGTNNVLYKSKIKVGSSGIVNKDIALDLTK